MFAFLAERPKTGLDILFQLFIMIFKQSLAVDVRNYSVRVQMSTSKISLISVASFIFFDFSWMRSPED